MLLSVVIPVYRGEKTIAKLVAKLHDELKHLDFNIILVNDGSPDNSEKVCLGLAEVYEKVHFISLRKNFGEFNAVMCGLNYANGNYTVIIDDDFQNPPSEILKLLTKAQEGDYDVVYSYYATKKHHVVRNIGSWVVNRITTWLIHKPQDLYLSSFKLMSKDLITEIVKYKGPYPYIDALVFRTTNRVSSVQVEHNDRLEGESNYTVKKLVRLFMIIVFGYSNLPIRFVQATGLILTSLSVLLFILFFTNVLHGWGLAALCFFSGIQISVLGIVGEYIGKFFLTQNGTPQYVEKYNSLNAKQ
ncbi:glycosyltransferase family 2 protein [Emticicia sp. 21SJ11W-3]|uniref:glycosyltransferase family 2 protein n=1 Tax=Emticicia sp. 21SJ11W-3 TaxID=2916755 RepID=UPI0020A1FE52|nr:glycosyltransferase family 2 protein [Emticicia sp. 21SJ11W-3]UTA66236.1 glycosyltransferase family 2 protein [Emticicia sp. 21SJ11W-3]